MDLHELPFEKIIILQKDIAEVTVNDGVEINKSMVLTYHAFLLIITAPFNSNKR